MLSEICAEIRNYFLRDAREDIHYGTFTISDGSIAPLPFLQTGQYFRIKGSVFNDGVWKYGEDELTDETFNGEVWAMAVPHAVVSLAQEIDDWISENSDALSSPYASESFGGYSYSMKSGSGATAYSTTSYGWVDQFASKLSPYRRLRVL